MPARKRCPDCDGGFVSGDGKCNKCHGSGINPGLEEGAKCPVCQGTGVCQSCGGSGFYEGGGLLKRRF